MKPYIMLAFVLISCKSYIPCNNPELIAEEYLKTITANFNSNINDESYILFSELFTKKIKKKQIVDFLDKTKSNYGRILNYFKVPYKKNDGMVFKIIFEKSDRQLLIKLDNKCKIETFILKDLIISNESASKLSLPFDSIWYTHWGGNTLKQNYHVKSRKQRGAIDFAIKNKNGNTYQDNRKQNKNFYAWDENIISPCDGTILKTVDSILDNTPGKINSLYPKGNYVLMKCNDQDDEFIFLCHLKKESLVTKENEDVLTGQVLAKCGNSGRSTEPHLHFHIQNSLNDSLAIGLAPKFYGVVKSNDNKVIDNYSPVKGDYIKNSD